MAVTSLLGKVGFMGDSALGNLLTLVAGNELTSLFREAYGKLDKLLADGAIDVVPRSSKAFSELVCEFNRTFHMLTKE